MRNSIPFGRVWAPSAADRRYQDSVTHESLGTWAEQVASPGRRRMGLNIQMNRLVTVGSASVEYCDYLCCYCKWWKTEGGPVHTTCVHPEIRHSSGAERQPPEGRPSPPSSSSPSFFLLIFFLFLCPLSPSPSSFFKKIIYLFCLCWVFVAVRGLSLVMEGGRSSLAVVLSLLMAGASLVCRAQALAAWSSALAERGLSGCGTLV